MYGGSVNVLCVSMLKRLCELLHVVVEILKKREKTTCTYPNKMKCVCLRFSVVTVKI